LQAVSKTIGTYIQFLIGQLFITENQRYGIRSTLDLVFEKLVNTPLAGRASRCGIPFYQ
jgi:hypothetical protein